MTTKKHFMLGVNRRRSLSVILVQQAINVSLTFIFEAVFHYFFRKIVSFIDDVIAKNRQVVTPANAGVRKPIKWLDPRLHGNDKYALFGTFYKVIKDDFGGIPYIESDGVDSSISLYNVKYMRVGHDSACYMKTTQKNTHIDHCL